MNGSGETLIHVRDGWNGWRGAEVCIDDLTGVHWSQPDGAPRGLVHAYVLCTRIRGYMPHDCDAHTGPHRLLVCVLRRWVAPSVYTELARRADALAEPAAPDGTVQDDREADESRTRRVELPHPAPRSRVIGALTSVRGPAACGGGPVPQPRSAPARDVG